MKFNTWLDEEVGRLTRVADAFQISLSAVSQWRDNGVPPIRMKAVRELTGGRVSLEEMIPDAPCNTTDASIAQTVALDLEKSDQERRDADERREVQRRTAQNCDEGMGG